MYPLCKMLKEFGFRMLLKKGKRVTRRCEMLKAARGNLRSSARDEYNELSSPEVFILGKKQGIRSLGLPQGLFSYVQRDISCCLN